MMRITSPELSPVEKSIYLTVISRARDAESTRPILDDKWSVTVRDRLEYDLDALHLPGKEKFTVAIRGRQMDDWCRTFIKAHPDAVVIELGCGLDDRANRVSPPDGVDWYDVDFNAVMELRGMLGTPRPTTGTVHDARVDATQIEWIDPLPSDRPVFVIADGFMPFIERDRMIALLHALVEHFPSGEIALNGYTTFTAGLLKMIHAIKVIGLTPGVGSAFDEPHVLEAWEPRLHLVARSSLSRSPYVERMPWGQRVACRVLNWFPTLAAKSDIGVLLYRF